MLVRGATSRAGFWPRGLGLVVLGLLLSFVPTWAQQPPSEEVKKDALRVELKRAIGAEPAKAGLAQTPGDVKTLEADLARKKLELDIAVRRLEQARAIAGRNAAAGGAKKGGVTIRIEIKGLDAEPEALKALVDRLEKELPGKERKVIIVSAPQTTPWRIMNQVVPPGAPAGAAGWKIINQVAPGSPPDGKVKQGPFVVEVGKEGSKPLPAGVIPGGKIVKDPIVVVWDKDGAKLHAKEGGRTEGLEKKLDGLLKELAELRRELSQPREKEAPRPGRK